VRTERIACWILRRVRIERVAWGKEKSDKRAMLLGGRRRVRIEKLSGGWRRVIIG